MGVSLYEGSSAGTMIVLRRALGTLALVPSNALANHVLDLVRAMGFNVGVTQINRLGVGDVWHLDARHPDGQTWIAEDADLYKAAVMLAEFVGADLEE